MGSKNPPKPPSALKDLSMAVIKHIHIDSQKLDLYEVLKN